MRPPPLVGNDATIDWLKPEIVIYEPEADGSLQLVSVEYLVFEAAGIGKPPEFHGHEFTYMVDNPTTPLDEAHGFEAHYDLHVWLYRHNPRGMFAPWNPAVSCAHHTAHTSE